MSLNLYVIVPLCKAASEAVNLAFIAALRAASTKSESTEPVVLSTSAEITLPWASTLILITTSPAFCTDNTGLGKAPLKLRPSSEKPLPPVPPAPLPPPVRLPESGEPSGEPWLPGRPLSPSPLEAEPSTFCPGKLALGFKVGLGGSGVGSG